MIVYLITNTVSAKSYVGQTNKSLQNRWSEHCYLSRKNPACVFHWAIRKYGEEAFTLSVLREVASKEEANFYESLFIKSLDTKVPHGYNMTDGGDGTIGCVPSEKNRKASSLKHKGIKLSPEHRAKLRAAALNRSEEHRRNLSNAMKGRSLSEEAKRKVGAAQKGKRLSADHIDKLRAAHRRGPHSEETKRKISLTKRSKNPRLFDA